MSNWKAEKEAVIKTQNTQPQLLCDRRGYTHTEKSDQGGKKKVLMACLPFSQWFSPDGFLKALFVMLVSYWSLFWFFLVAWEYPVCEPICKSNKNYWFWIGKKVCAYVTTNCKWMRKEAKKYYFFAVTSLTHNGLLLLLWQVGSKDIF